MKRRAAKVQAVSPRRASFLAVAAAALLAVIPAAQGDEPECTGRSAVPAAAGIGIIDVMRDRILAHSKLQPGMVVAEIGVGPGWFVIRVAEAVGPNGVVYGTDIDPKAIAALRQRLPRLPPGGRVELRLCDGPRDTALDDLPDGRVDLILIVDSVCFDASEPRERNVDYLRRFLRILRPGGRLLHHMDCRCKVSPNGVVALFGEAGFSPSVDVLDVSPEPTLIDATWECRSAAERERHAFVGIFRKPDTSAPGKSPGVKGEESP